MDRDFGYRGRWISLVAALALAGCAKPSDTGHTDTPIFLSITCKNPLDMKSSEKTSELSAFSQTEYQLASFQLYMLYEDTQESFLTSSQESENFQPKIDCNGLEQDPQVEPIKLKAGIQFAQILNPQSRENLQDRALELEFSNGNLKEAKSFLKPTENAKNATSERHEISPDTFLTVQVFASEEAAEERILIEYPADEKGARVKETGIAHYRRTNH